MRFLTLMISLMLAASPASGIDVRVARIDVERVFNEYEHTKEINHAIDLKRHGRATKSEDSEIEELRRLKERLADLSMKVKQVATDTPERVQLEEKEKMAALEMQIVEMKRALENLQRTEAASEETRRNRDQIIKEISSEAKSLASQHGYVLVVFENTPFDTLSNAVLLEKCDDVTDELLARLNLKYREKR